MWRISVFFMLMTAATPQGLTMYECGRVTPKGTPLVTNGAPVARGEFPWHVGVYQWYGPTEEEKSPNLKVICGGSLISSKLVISAAHCFWNDHTQSIKDSRLYAAAAGKVYRKWDSDNETTYSQQRNITEILIPELYRSSHRKYADDIALLVLDQGFRFRPYLRPVCLDFDPQFEESQLTSGSMGKVAGWGFASENGALSEELQVVALPFVARLDCIERSPPLFKEYITPDKLCAGFTNGTTVCKGDSGGGLVFAREGRYYLRGVVSTKPNGEVLYCNTLALATFTRISWHQELILSRFQSSELDAEIRLISGTNKCKLPPYPDHGTYTVEGNPLASPGFVLDGIAILQLECDPGYRYVPEDASTNATLVDSGAVVCYSGQWKYKYLPKCDFECGRAPLPDGQLAPWRAQIFQRGFYRCDATLVRLDVLITEGSCIIEWVDETTTRFLSKLLLKVTAGEQSSKVVDMVKPPHYDANQGDIAIVFVEPFQLTPSVQPACVDPLTTTPSAGQSGNAVSNNTEVMLRVQNTCRSKEINFCAMTKDNANLATGSGLVVPVQTGNETRYFLRGVVVSNRVWITRKKLDNVFMFRRLDNKQQFLREHLSAMVNTY